MRYSGTVSPLLGGTFQRPCLMLHTDQMGNRLVLLGAGASVDAGVPASTAMTEQIVRALNVWQHQHSGLAGALNYAVGAMIAHDSAREGSPYDGIDVESLFSAIQMLSSKDALEIAPFVTWSPALTSLRGTQSVVGPGSDHDLKQALEGRGGRTVPQAVRAMIAGATHGDVSDALFARLEGEMLDVLRSLLVVDESRLGYLAPLLNDPEGPVTIATLNYDLAIETLAASRGKSVDTGIQTWRTGAEWVWQPSADIRLLKLHGSIDWLAQSVQGAGGIHEEAVTAVMPEAESTRRTRPGIVFGARGKVRPEGPFLPMLRELDNVLATSDTLLIVGYSFRDEHINVALSRWVNAKPGRTMRVVEPHFSKLAERRGPKFGYAWRLKEAANYFDGASRTHKRGLDLHVIEEYAATGIAKAIAEPDAGRWPPIDESNGSARAPSSVPESGFRVLS